ncbi:hypothetical protein D3C78_1496010 [compost metagenome]
MKLNWRMVQFYKVKQSSFLRVLVGVIWACLVKLNSKTRVLLIAHTVMVLYLLENMLLLLVEVTPVLKQRLTLQVLLDM